MSETNAELAVRQEAGQTSPPPNVKDEVGQSETDGTAA